MCVHCACNDAALKDDNKQPRELLLWHGTRGANVCKVVDEGVDPRFAKAGGNMFGKLGVGGAETMQESREPVVVI